MFDTTQMMKPRIEKSMRGFFLYASFKTFFQDAAGPSHINIWSQLHLFA